MTPTTGVRLPMAVLTQLRRLLVEQQLLDWWGIVGLGVVGSAVLGGLLAYGLHLVTTVERGPRDATIGVGMVPGLHLTRTAGRARRQVGNRARRLTDHARPGVLSTLDPRSADPAGVVALVVPLVLVVASETLLFFGYLDYALVGHTVTLLVCTLAPLRLTAETNTFGAFALVPIFRLVNLGMPVFFQLTVFWFPLIYGPLIPALYLFAERQAPVDPDLRWKRAGLLLLPLALPLSVILAEIEYRILRPEALIPAWDPVQLLLITVVMVGFVGLVEELLFRGVLQRALQHRIGQWSGLVLTSGIFGLMHSGYSVPAELAFAGGIGFVFGLLYDWTDSITLIAIVHGVLNVFLFAVIPMQGSVVTRLLNAMATLG